MGIMEQDAAWRARNPKEMCTLSAIIGSPCPTHSNVLSCRILAFLVLSLCRALSAYEKVLNMRGNRAELVAIYRAGTYFLFGGPADNEVRLAMIKWGTTLGLYIKNRELVTIKSTTDSIVTTSVTYHISSIAGVSSSFVISLALTTTSTSASPPCAFRAISPQRLRMRCIGD